MLQYRQLCQRLKATDPRLLFFFVSDLRADDDPDDGLLVPRIRETSLHATFVSQLDGHIRILIVPPGYEPSATCRGRPRNQNHIGRHGAGAPRGRVLGSARPEIPGRLVSIWDIVAAGHLRNWLEPLHRIHNHTRFRDVHGDLIADAGCQLLTDFVPDDVLASLPPNERAQVRDTVIGVSSQWLCQFLATAEAMQKLDDEQQTAFQVRALQEPTSPAAQPSKKRKAVSWAPASSNIEAGDGDSHRGDTSEDESPSRSKKQRTGAADPTYHASCRRGSANAEASERRRTRSSSRGAYVGNERRRLTRSRSRSEGLRSGVELSESLS